MGNLKERGRGPFNLEISKTHLICHSDLRCFHLFAVQIVIRFSRKEGDLLPCFHFIKATLRYRPIGTPHLPVQFYKNLCTGNIFLMLFLYTDMWQLHNFYIPPDVLIFSVKIMEMLLTCHCEMKTGMTGHSVSIVNLFYVFIGFTVMMQKVIVY